MHVIRAENIRDGFYYALNCVIEYGESEDTRLGKALVMQEPVTIQYMKPKQHVLLDKWRDANPFFHLMEAMWMLAGRQDAAFLDNYIHDFSSRYAKDGIVPDAYGYRWRYGLGFDQLEVIVNQLNHNPTSRQAVLQMWGAGKIDLHESIKPCNLVACFMIRNDKLDMTVYNRSNDLVWGCCGANAVHFPIMQEYVAEKLGVDIGYYWQVTNNLHLYKDHYDKLTPYINEIFNGHLLRYQETQPLISDIEAFNEDFEMTMIYLDGLHANESEPGYLGNMTNSFLLDTVIPMATSYWYYRHKDMDGALDEINKVTAEDWRIAGQQWLERRIK